MNLNQLNKKQLVIRCKNLEEEKEEILAVMNLIIDRDLFEICGSNIDILMGNGEVIEDKIDYKIKAHN